MNWLIGRKSKPTTENKLLMYRAILKPIWTYGVQLWGCAKPPNTKIIQRVQSKILRMVFNAPCYISNKTLHEDSGTPFAEDEIKRLTNSYSTQPSGTPQRTSESPARPPAARRRLHRQWATDVLDWTAWPHNKCYLYSESCHWTASPLNV